MTMTFVLLSTASKEWLSKSVQVLCMEEGKRERETEKERERCVTEYL